MITKKIFFKYALHPNCLEEKQRLFLMIDEVKYAANPSNILKDMYDTY